MNSEIKRSGRRPGSTATREDILAAAREAFTRGGYQKATIRGIAAEAKVDPALVMHYFGNKEELFRESIRPPIDPSRVLAAAVAADPANAGERIALVFLGAWEAELPRQILVSLVRAAMTEELAGDLVRQQIIGPVEVVLASLDADRPGFRAALIATRLIGLALGRYILHVPSLVEASAAELAAAIGPELQRYINGPITHTTTGGSQS